MAHLSNDTTAKLIALWRSGATGTEIAKALKTTRNAVIGKIFRLRSNGVDLSRATIPATPKPPRPPKAEKPAKKVFKPPRPKEAWPPPLTDKEQEALIAEKRAQMERERRARGVKFDDLRPRDCRFILNAGHPSGYLFCGCTRSPGKPYCQEHAELCYRPSNPR